MIGAVESKGTKSVRKRLRDSSYAYSYAIAWVDLLFVVGHNQVTRRGLFL